MSAQTADTNRSFHLPSMSYIDAKWEEPGLREPARAIGAETSRGVAAWFAARLSALRTWYGQQQIAAELVTMNDRELHDMGLTRSDLDRVFDPDLNQDLRQRGRR